MGALRLVGAIQGQESSNKPLKELLFVDVTLNRRATQVLVNTGATHNFIAEVEAKQLGLKLKKDTSKIKAFNLVAQPIARVAKGVTIVVGPAQALVDTRATHNFIAEVEAKRLKLEKDTGKIKAVNSVAQPVTRVAKVVTIAIKP